MTGKGRVLAVDVGEKRIGVALSDPLRFVARPLMVIQHVSREEDFAAIGRLVREHQVGLIVCGYPLSLDGSEGPQGRFVRHYAEELAEALTVRVELRDESYSTAEAESIMVTTGKRMTRNERRARIDAVAAAVILQGYLDAVNASGSPVGDCQELDLG